MNKIEGKVKGRKMDGDGWRGTVDELEKSREPGRGKGRGSGGVKEWIFVQETGRVSNDM